MNGIDILEGLQNKFINLRNGGLINLVEIEVDENMDVLEDLLIEQLESGRDGTGQPIRPRYQSESYAAVKQQLNSKPPSGTPDLKLTGDFHRGIFGVRSGDVIEFDSRDSKTDELVFKYGQAILEHNEESIEKFNEQLLKPNLIESLKELLNA